MHLKYLHSVGRFLFSKVVLSTLQHLIIKSSVGEKEFFPLFQSESTVELSCSVSQNPEKYASLQGQLHFHFDTKSSLAF